MASVPPADPDRIEPSAPPEKSPPIPEPSPPQVPETEPVTPDIDEPGRMPEELPPDEDVAWLVVQSARRTRQASAVRDQFLAAVSSATTS